MKIVIKMLLFIIVSLFVCSSSFCVAANTITQNSAVTSVKASHILVNTKEEADLIKSKLNNGESFENLAKKYSKCPSGKEGGDLGYFRRGEMVKPFEDAAFNLPIGSVSSPVRTQFGWHLIKVYDKR